MNKVSVAFIGMGYRGKQLFRLLRNIPFFQILAVADPGVEPSELPDISCYNHGAVSYTHLRRDNKYVVNGSMETYIAQYFTFC